MDGTGTLATRPGLWTALISATIYLILGYLLLLPRGEPVAPGIGPPLSLATAVSNGLTFAFLTAGWLTIRRGDRVRHRRYMVLAFLSITAFLLLYVVRQALAGTLHFGGPEVLYRFVYLPILIPHLAISTLCIPPVVYNFVVGLTRPLHRVGATLHPAVGRVVVPLWMVSSAMGLVVFALLQGYSVGG